MNDLQKQAELFGFQIEDYDSHIQWTVGAYTFQATKRPHYCDRGDWIVHVLQANALPGDLDGSDKWPRYLFDSDLCLHVAEWLRKRGETDQTLLSGIASARARLEDSPPSDWRTVANAYNIKTPDELAARIHDLAEWRLTATWFDIKSPLELRKILEGHFRTDEEEQ